MKRTISLRLFSLLLPALLLMSQLSGCANVYAGDLIADFTPRQVEARTIDEPFITAVTDFSLLLFGETAQSGENCFLSPLSALIVLSMIANGADGNTLAQIEQTLGLPVEELNIYLHSFTKQLASDSSVRLTLSNSVWFKDTQETPLKVYDKFLQTCADYYEANAFAEPFDSGTVRKINQWANKETDGQIPAIIDEIPENMLLYLINAILFEGKWAEKYEKSNILDHTFTATDGSEQTVSFLFSEESHYFEASGATGFWKPYKGEKYAFLGILPPENSTPEEYLRSLNAEAFLSMIKKASDTCKAGIPEFTVDFSADLIPGLTGLGITDAFTGEVADFSNMASIDLDGKPYIGIFRQCSHIQVDRNGTKASAVSIAGIKNDSDPIQINQVILDRPFIYGILDVETGIPLFIGCMNQME